MSKLKRKETKKRIYGAIVELTEDMVCPKMKNSAFVRVNDKQMVIKKITVDIICIIVGLIGVYMYFNGMFGKYIRVNKEVDKIKKEIELYNNGEIDAPRINVYTFKDLGEEAYRKQYLDKRKMDTVDFILWQPMLLFGLFPLYLGMPRVHRFIFDREKGTVTYPGFMGLRRITVPFNQAVFTYTRLGSIYAAEREKLALVHPNGLTTVIVDFEHITAFFSLYVWYMDKNRPLPPGTAFDAYRKADFLRRYREGFPEPLYPSNIEIKEYRYTPEPADFDNNNEYLAYVAYAAKHNLESKMQSADPDYGDSIIPMLYDDEFNAQNNNSEKKPVDKDNPFLKKKSKSGSKPMFNRRSSRR